MKSTLIGTIFILCGLFLTPCFIDPTDFITSPLYIAGLVAWVGTETAALILPIWIAIGYVFILIGVLLIGKDAIKRFGLGKCVIFMHPIFYIALICTIAVLLTAFIYYTSYM